MSSLSLSLDLCRLKGKRPQRMVLAVALGLLLYSVLLLC